MFAVGRYANSNRATSLLSSAASITLVECVLVRVQVYYTIIRVIGTLYAAEPWVDLYTTQRCHP